MSSSFTAFVLYPNTDIFSSRPLTCWWSPMKSTIWAGLTWPRAVNSKPFKSESVLALPTTSGFALLRCSFNVDWLRWSHSQTSVAVVAVPVHAIADSPDDGTSPPIHQAGGDLTVASFDELVLLRCGGPPPLVQFDGAEPEIEICVLFENMKFGETFTEYLHGEEEKFLEKCRHVEYKKLKKVLKNCKTCNSSILDDEQITTSPTSLSDSCQCQSCPWCDEKFFDELMKEASDIAGCFRSRVRHLLHLHVATGMQRYMMRLRRCFTDDRQALLQEGQILIQYITMNAIAIRKILKKYDKVHSSVNGKNFKLKMRAERIELLHSPWLIELGAFYLNSGLDKDGKYKNSFGRVSCDNLNDDQPMMQLKLPNSIDLEFDLTCAICLETVFNPYALKCGHIFCKACACSAASVMIFQGVKAASQQSRCPICREAGVYAEAVHMMELHLLLKIKSKEYWKERMMNERSEMLKQSKMFWNEQTKHMIGY